MTTLPESQLPESSDPQPVSSGLDFSRLTHQNWLFINAFLSTRSIRKSYGLAKYEGVEESAPYQVFKRLKPYIEQIGDLDVTSRARLQADLKGVLDLPLEERKSLTLKEWLEVRKFTAKITPEALPTRPQLSVLIINRPSKAQGIVREEGKVTTPSTDIPPQSIKIPSEVIDIQPLEPDS